MTFWTDEKKAEVKRHWLAGKSALWIANETGAASRNAVIGAVGRMGLLRSRKKPPRIRLTTSSEPSQPSHVTFDELRAHHCRYPFGDRDFTYCGQPKGDGPYCAEHAALCYQPPSEWRQKSADKNSLWHAQRAA